MKSVTSDKRSDKRRQFIHNEYKVILIYSNILLVQHLYDICMTT